MTESDLLEMTPEDFTGEGAARYEDLVDRAREEGTTRFEATFQTAPGADLPVEVRTSMIRFRGDPAFLSVARDNGHPSIRVCDHVSSSRSIPVDNDEHVDVALPIGKLARDPPTAQISTCWTGTQTGNDGDRGLPTDVREFMICRLPTAESLNFHIFGR